MSIIIDQRSINHTQCSCFCALYRNCETITGEWGTFMPKDGVFWTRCKCCCLIRVSHKSDTQHKLRPLDWSRKCESCPWTDTVYFQILNSFHSNSQPWCPRWHLYLWTTINYITVLLCDPNTDSDCHQTWIWDMVLFGNGVMHFMLWFNVVHKFPLSNIIEWKRE